MTSSPAEIDELLTAAASRDSVTALRDLGLADEAGLTWLLERVDDLDHEDPVTADELASLAARSADELCLLTVGAQARYLRARILAERGEFGASLELIDLARAGWLAAGSPLSALRTDLGRMHILDDLGRHQDAIETGRRLIAELSEAPDTLDPDERDQRRYLWAATHENLGVASSYTGSPERALECYALAEEAYFELGQDAEVARLRANRGVELLELGRAREALDVLDKAATLFAEAGDRVWWAKCQAFVARAHQQLGGLVHALNVLEPSRAALDEMGADAEAARVRIAIANAYLDVGLFAQADAAASEAIALTDRSGMDHDSAAAHLSQALAQLGGGDVPGAAQRLARAQELFEKVGDRQYAARAQLVESEVAEVHGDLVRAKVLAERATVRLRAGGWLVPLAWALLRQARLADDDDEADRNLRAAGDLIGELRDPLLTYQLDLAVAKQHRRRGDVAAAELTLRRAVNDVDRLTSSLSEHSLLSAFRAGRLGAHTELVDLLVDRGGADDLAEACAVSDRAKSRVLGDLVSRTVGSRVSASGNTAVHAELQERRADLHAVYAAMHDADSSAKRATLRADADLLEAQVESLRLRLVARQGPMEGMTSAPSTSLDPHVTGIAYHVVGRDVLAFVTVGGELRLHRLSDVVPRIRVELERLAGQWSRFQVGGSFARRNEAVLLRTTNAILAELHTLVLEPLLADLGDEAAGHELLVVPHGLLGEVPFHALLGADGPVVERYAVTISSALAGSHPSTPVGAAGALVLAVPDDHAPAVQAEAMAIVDAFPASELLMGAAASVDALVAHTPGPAIVHLACHGVYRAGNPLFSRLRLGDRWLTCAEALDLDLGGAIVTLSACDSGRHREAGAEPVGLAWAFLAAGASGVLVSRWTVHDAATAELMADLYRRLGAGLTPPHALREAQLAVAATHPHPFHWAPFSYVSVPFQTQRDIS